MDRTNPIVEPCTVLEEYPRGVGAARWGLMDGRIRRAPYRDALLVGDDLLLFIDQSPVRVQGIGITIWFAAADAPTLDEITDA